MKVKKALGYSAAALTVVAAILIPFLLIDLFTRGVAATGVCPDRTMSAPNSAHADEGSLRAP